MNTFKRETYRSTAVSAKQSAADLDWAIGLHRKVLKIFGLWSYVGETKWQTVRSNSLTFLFVVSAFCFITLPQTTALIKVWGNMMLVVENLITNVAVTMSEVKLIIVWLNKKALAKLLDKMTSDWFREKTAYERQVMLQYAKITRIMTITGLIFVAFCVVFLFTPIIFDFSTRTINNLTDKPGRHFPLQAVYFYDTSSIHIYHLTVITQTFGLSCGAFCYSGIDIICGMLVLHICGQLKNLSNSIPTMVKDAERRCFQDILNTFIETHCRLIRNVKIIESIVSWIMLSVAGSFVVVFSVIGFQIVQEFASATSDGTIPQLILYTTLLLASVFFLFVYSWVGEYLVTQSNSLHMAVCSCNWRNLTSKQALQLIIILVRTQYPLQLTTGKIAPLTMSTYLSILKSCGGYISCLLAVRK